MNEHPEIQIIRETSEFVVINKPSGYMVHRSKIAADRFGVVDFLKKQLSCDLAPGHRLDRQTSGVMIFSKNHETSRILNECFANRKVNKVYQTLVRGQFPENITVERKLKSDKGVLQDSATDFKLVEQFKFCALINASPKTGRRHQIRRHLDGISHQIIGDTKHGKGKINALYRQKYALKRMFLHASSLKIDHPLFENEQWSCPLNKELQTILATIREEIV